MRTLTVVVGKTEHTGEVVFEADGPNVKIIVPKKARKLWGRKETE